VNFRDVFPASEMTYIVSSGALNSTQSLTHSPKRRFVAVVKSVFLCVCVNENDSMRDTEIDTIHQSSVLKLSAQMK